MALYWTGIGTEVPLSSNATKSMWLLNPVTKKLKVVEFAVSFDGSSPAEACLVALYRVTTLGSPAGTAQTPRTYDPDEQAATTTTLINLTTEPTAMDLYDIWEISPYGGLFVKQFPLGREFIADAGGARVGLKIITPTGVTPGAASYVIFEE